jgi:succinyl-CoA synthetase beta subunit
MLAPAATVELLNAYGFQCAQAASATTLAEADAAATRLGFPVILKAIVPDLAHRSDAGLVSRCIANAGELASEFARVVANAKSLGAALIPVSVEKFVAHDLEIILGVKYDATFGPVVLCGLGGIFTEVLKDFALRLAPLSKSDAVDMLSSLKAYAVLKKTPARIELLSDALLHLSDLTIELNGKIQALDINPIALGAADLDAIVLDAKIHI